MSTEAIHDIEAHGEEEHHHPNYLLVFVALAILTAAITGIELLAQAGTINLPRSLLNTVFLAMSVIKALLVVLFYMHLKYDSKVYSLLFGLPVLFAVVFVALLLIF
jgi:cytochrome c oxidase subunit 4